MVRLPWLPIMAQYLEQQASVADAAYAQLPPLQPPSLNVLHTCEAGLRGEACAWCCSGSRE